MSLNRRSFVGLLCAGSATALSGTLVGCGGSIALEVPTRFVWLLNLNPEFGSTDVSWGGVVVAFNLPFQALTSRIEIEYGIYSLGLQSRQSGRTLFFDNTLVDEATPPVQIFYRKGSSARLGAAVRGVVNYFDSKESLIVDLADGTGSVQTTVLAFEGSTSQASFSSTCRLRLSRASDGVTVYDSGLVLRARADSILIFPADTTTGLVAVVGLNYSASEANAMTWPNSL
jgi:hypothetical protein